MTKKKTLKLQIKSDKIKTNQQMKKNRIKQAEGKKSKGKAQELHTNTETHIHTHRKPIKRQTIIYMQRT